MSTYKVIEVAPDGALRAAVRELVEPAAGQVRIRVEACGICHTDTFSVQPHEAGSGDRVPGHEVVGAIDAVGAGVEGWSAGQRAGVGFLGGHCGACESCRRGNFVACTNQPWTTRPLPTTAWPEAAPVSASSSPSDGTSPAPGSQSSGPARPAAPAPRSRAASQWTAAPAAALTAPSVPG